MEQIAVRIAHAAADGVERIAIQLRPAELGRIEVRMEFGPDGTVQASFAADRPQTLDLLQRDARQLERAFADAGLRADAGGLSFNLRGQDRNAPTPFGETARVPVVIDDIDSPAPPVLRSGGAGAGRLDIRV